MVTKVIIALLLFSQGTMIEHTITDGVKDCLEKKKNYAKKYVRYSTNILCKS